MTDTDDSSDNRTPTRRRIVQYIGVTAATTTIASSAAAQENGAEISTSTNVTLNGTDSNTNETDTNETETNETETNETDTNETDTNETETNETETNETDTNETETNETETNETDTNETETDPEDDSSTNSTDDAQTDDSDESGMTAESDVCTGQPGMSTTSVTTPNSKITTEDPAVVEANFRPEPTIPDECTIMADLEFSFADGGFQWSGGSNWDQSASNLLVGSFEVRPGEVRSIRGQLHTQGAEEGDSVTVVADYELWFKGDRENSVQQTGIRRTIDVESPNEPSDTTEESEGSSVTVETPGFGITAGIASLLSAGAVAKSRLTNDE